MPKYHNEEWLRQQYHGERKSSTEMAEECDVSPPTILDWMERHGIERRSQKESHAPDKPYTNKEWLREQYVDNRRSMADIGEECDVTAAVILKWLRRFDIDTRDSVDHKRVEPIQVLDSGGYRVVQSSVTVNGEREYDRAYVHQLIAIAEGADPEKVFSDGAWHCHHKNGIRWDNRPENIVFTAGEEHMRGHSRERVRTATGEWE